MIASELAKELGISPGTMSKHLDVYHEENDTEKESELKPDTITNIRKAHALHKSRQAKTFRDAVCHVLDIETLPLPPKTAIKIELRLAQMETDLATVRQQVGQILEIMLETQRQRRAQAARTAPEANQEQNS